MLGSLEDRACWAAWRIGRAGIAHVARYNASLSTRVLGVRRKYTPKQNTRYGVHSGCFGVLGVQARLTHVRSVLLRMFGCILGNESIQPSGTRLHPGQYHARGVRVRAVDLPSHIIRLARGFG